MRCRTLVASLLLTLSACQLQREQGLPSPAVLRGAALANQSLQSAVYTVEGYYRGRSPFFDGLLRFRGSGRLQDAGRQLAADVTVDGEVEEPFGSEVPQLAAAVSFVVADEDEVYVKVDHLDMQPQHPVWSSAMVRGLLGRWLLLPPPPDPASSPAVTPDPRFLRAQAEVVLVTRDHGFTKMHGRKVYHYSTAIDEAKLRSFLGGVAAADDGSAEASTASVALAERLQGELWIDAENFFVHRLRWWMRQGENNGEGEFIVDLTEHNAAPPVELPQGAEPLLPLLQEVADLQPASPPLEGQRELSPLEEELFQDLLDEARGSS